MSVLIINTLPQDEPAAQKAIQSLTAKDPVHKVFHTEHMRISPCIGCNNCWLRTPGVCSIKDDYEEILKAYLQYDTIVLLAGTALGFVSYKAKNVIDRILPLDTMYICVVDDEARHVPRYDKKYRIALLYAGEADREYLSYWLSRVALNLAGESIGAFPIEACEEVSL